GWIEGLKVGVANFVDAIATLFKNFFNTVKGIFKAGTEILKGNWKGALNILKTTLSQNIENIIGLFIRMQDRIGNWARGMKDKFLTWGRDMIQNLINGIKEKISAVGDAISGVADKIREYIHFSEPDMGPLSDFHTYAPDMMKMFAKGILDNTDIVTDAVDKMASDMLSVDASADIRAVASDTGARVKSQGGGNIIFNNSFVINGSNKNARELAEEISYYLEADRQRIAGAYA
ncbi:MAG: hypothetical protein K5870_05445, partial [Lachnospiraceae bacterium]|nr:hypothetical protein [Lachnospiraceae bacterium]